MDTTDSAPNEGKQEMEISTVQAPRPTVKLSPMEFYEKTLGAPKYVVSETTPFLEGELLLFSFFFCRQWTGSNYMSPFAMIII